MHTQTATIVSVLGGLLGGAALIATEWVRKPALAVIGTYAILLLLLAVILRRGRIEGFGRRFSLLLTAFMIATVVAMTYIVTVSNPAALQSGLWRNVWPLLLMAAIGSVSSLPIAALTRTS